MICTKPKNPMTFILVLTLLFVMCARRDTKDLPGVITVSLFESKKANLQTSLDAMADPRGIYGITYDSCEYLYISNNNASWGSHKGNCKYCAARAAKRDSALVRNIRGQ